MWYFIIGFIAFVVLAMIVGSKKSNKYAKELLERGMDLRKFIFSAKFIYGHPSINDPIEKSFIYLFHDYLSIYELPKNEFHHVEKATIPFSCISNITIEDKTTIQTRVGLKRLLVAGIFAFAMKKKQKLEVLYLVIEWNDNSFLNESVFEFEGSNVQFCSPLKNEIQKAVIKYRKLDKNV